MKRLFGFTKKLINSDYIFSVFTKLLGVVVGIAVGSITARYFGVELRGVLAVVQNDVGLYSIVIGLGIYHAYPFYRKKEPELFHDYINNVTGFFLLLEAIAVVVAFLVYNLGDVYFAFSILFIPEAAYKIQLGYAILVEYPRRRNFSTIFIYIIEIVTLVILWCTIEASVTTVLGYYIFTAVLSLMLVFVNLRVNPLKIRPTLKRMPEFVKFGFVYMLVSLCMNVNYKVDIQMLKYFDNVSYADIGIYSSGVSLATKIWLIPDAVKDILLSKLMKGGKETEVAKVLRVNLALCLLATLMLVVTGKPLVWLFYGESFADSYYVMIWMLIGVIGMIFYKMVYSYNVSRGRRWINLVILGAAAVVNVVGNLFAIPVWGIWGAAAVSVISYVVCGICFLVYFRIASGISMFKLIFVQREDIVMIKNFFVGGKTVKKSGMIAENAEGSDEKVETEEKEN